MGPWRQMEMTAASNAASSGGYCGFCADHGDNINIAVNIERKRRVRLLGSRTRACKGRYRISLCWLL